MQCIIYGMCHIVIYLIKIFTINLLYIYVHDFYVYYLFIYSLLEKIEMSSERYGLYNSSPEVGMGWICSKCSSVLFNWFILVSLIHIFLVKDLTFSVC